MRYKYTDEDIDFLKIYYPIGDWDTIHKKFPNLSNTAIHRKMQKLGIKSKKLHTKNFNNSSTRRRWTEEEIAIVVKNYEKFPFEDIMNMLPNRSKNSIIGLAKRYNLVSYGSTHNKWSNNEIKYVIDNWELQPDKIIADKIGRTFRAVKAKREELGLYRQDMNSNSYPTLSKYLRGQNQQWKKASMKNCNYQCVLTKSKDFEIHHLYGVSNIISDILNTYTEYKDKDFSDYTEEDLSFILEKFIGEQAKYPLGECVDKNLHVLFHSMYGQYYNTPEQWHQFKNDYLEGKYEEYT